MAKKSLGRLVLYAAILLAIFLPGFAKMQELRGRSKSLDEDIERLTDENRKLKEEQERLKKDPYYIEKTARRKMGLVKKGELIYRVEPGEKKEY